MRCEKIFTVDTMNGSFPVSTCKECGREWETYQFWPDYVCEECDEAKWPGPPDGEDARDRDDR